MNQHASPNQAAPPGLYVDPERLFSLLVPAAWQVDASGQQGSRVALLHPTPEDGFRANVNVVVNLNPHLSPVEFLTLSRLQIKQVTGLAKLGIDEPAARPNSHLLEWSAQAGSALLQCRQLIVFGAARVFVVTATALLSRFESHRATFAAVLDSFKLPGLNDFSAEQRAAAVARLFTDPQ